MEKVVQVIPARKVEAGEKKRKLGGIGSGSAGCDAGSVGGPGI